VDFLPGDLAFPPVDAMSDRAQGPIYQWLFRNVLEKMDEEEAHRRAIRYMRRWGMIPGALAATEFLLRPPSGLHIETLGLEFRSPLVLAAGVDKDSLAFDALGALGFGGVEVGTATNFGQPGNPRPRMWRVPSEWALLNSMGFPNEGVEAQAPRLARRRTRSVIGVNIGKSKVVEVDDAVSDYRAAVRHVAPSADYLALNVSSPNTVGLRGMQTVHQLCELIAGVRAELDDLGRQLPVLVKLGPDLADEQIIEIGTAARSIGIDGLIAVNTTTVYDATPVNLNAIRASGGSGGLSGRPLKQRALDVLRLLAGRVDGLPLVSVGGVENAEDLWARILAGASLVQAHSGFVYGGPFWPHQTNRDLAGLLAESPYETIGEAVGKGTDFAPAVHQGVASSHHQATASLGPGAR
jgi:dihydroorotate dehydrogenase